MSRKLTRMERLTWLGGQMIPLAFATTARIKGQFSADDLQQALSKASQKHPLAGSAISIDKAGEPWFIPQTDSKIPVHVIAQAKKNAWVDIIKQELAQPFSDSTAPMVRFVWVQHQTTSLSDLIGFFHHGIADGLSGAYFMRDVLQYLGQPETSVEPLSFLPPIADLIPPEVEHELGQQLAQLQSTQPPPPAETDADAPLSLPPEMMIPPNYYLTAWTIPAEQVTALLQRARQEKTSVHAALGAAFMLAFADVLDDERGHKRRLQSPVNLRNRLIKPIGEDFGLFVSLLKTDVDCAPNRDFWEIARAIRVDTNQAITPENLFQMIVAFKTMAAQAPDFETLLRTMLSRREGTPALDWDLSLSNLGRLDFPRTYGDLELLSLYGPTFAASPEDKIVGVTTFRDQMHLTFIFREGTIASNVAEDIRQKAMDYLVASCQ